MKAFNKIFLLLLFSTMISLAQGGFKPGFVVNTKGDTTRGFIRFKDFVSSPKTISFKASLAAQPTELTPNDIVYWGINKGIEYKRYAGAITMDQTEISNVMNFRDTTIRFDAVFLRVLEKGRNVWFFSYADDIKTRFFIAESPDFKPVELIYRLYYDLDHVTLTRGKTVNENTYMTQLFDLANKYNVLDASLQKDIEWSAYRQLYMRDVIKKINKGHSN